MDNFFPSATIQHKHNYPKDMFISCLFEKGKRGIGWQKERIQVLDSTCLHLQHKQIKLIHLLLTSDKIISTWDILPTFLHVCLLLVNFFNLFWHWSSRRSNVFFSHLFPLRYVYLLINRSSFTHRALWLLCSMYHQPNGAAQQPAVQTS